MSLNTPCFFADTRENITLQTLLLFLFWFLKLRSLFTFANEGPQFYTDGLKARALESVTWPKQNSQLHFWKILNKSTNENIMTA